MSKDDDMFLENQEFKIPVVLFNRHSEHYSSVCTDNLSIGRNAAQLFAQNQIRRACLVTGEKLSLPGEERMYGFINECERLSVPLPKHLIFRVDKMLEGGKQAGNLIPVDSGAPDGVFFSESFMAVSALHCLQRRGASIPERMSLLCYGDESSEEFTIPSLSSIRMPIEEMSHDCIRLLMEVSQSGSIELRSVLHQPTLILRESFEPREKDAVMHE